MQHFSPFGKQPVIRILAIPFYFCPANFLQLSGMSITEPLFNDSLANQNTWTGDAILHFFLYNRSVIDYARIFWKHTFDKF